MPDVFTVFFFLNKDDGLVQEFFSYAYALAGYIFSKSPTPPLPPPPPPPPPPQKLNGRPLIIMFIIVCWGAGWEGAQIFLSQSLADQSSSPYGVGITLNGLLYN